MRALLSAAVLTTATLGSMGCATVFGSDPAVVSASPQAVTLRFEEGRLEDAQQSADDHCSTYSRRAVLQRVTPEGGDRVGIFDCVA